MKCDHLGSAEISAELLVIWVSLGMSSSGGVSFIVVNMALLINNNHISFNHMDAYHSCMLGHSYFTSPDYFVVKPCTKGTVLFTSFIKLSGTTISVYVQIIPGVVEYCVQGLPCQCIVAMVNVAHPFILTAHTSFQVRIIHLFS